MTLSPKRENVHYMTSSNIVQYTCDLCGYAGPYSRPEDFAHFPALGLPVDLCRWCANDRDSSRVSSGGHEITFTQEGASWVCDCGMTFERARLYVWRPARVIGVVPNLRNALASMHLERKL